MHIRIYNTRNNIDKYNIQIIGAKIFDKSFELWAWHIECVDFY